MNKLRGCASTNSHALSSSCWHSPPVHVLEWTSKRPVENQKNPSRRFQTTALSYLRFYPARHPSTMNKSQEETAPVNPELSPGFIGSPCRSSSDCRENLECADEDEGFDNGHCTQECELYCPDLEGYPTTFCPDLGDALTRCFSRCEPQPSGSQSNCRQGYRCVPMPRANAPQVVQHVCAPSAGSQTPASATTDVAWCKALNASTRKRASVMPSSRHSIQKSSVQMRRRRMPNAI